ncbi:hypothetical protein [Methylobacter psychrophilus]|uniref:hypothetical protein n=1 Tax=Methylobacter psychrophilus TaxID=96941 RepID=UPI0021D4F368|nr:hypothetical protein [Methylobacter psychrophilus]
MDRNYGGNITLYTAEILNNLTYIAPNTVIGYKIKQPLKRLAANSLIYSINRPVLPILAIQATDQSRSTAIDQGVKYPTRKRAVLIQQGWLIGQ